MFCLMSLESRIAADHPLRGIKKLADAALRRLSDRFDASTFSRNRQRMLDSDIAAQFFQAVRDQGAELMSREHFSVDGTLIESWASIKSFRPKDDDPGQGDSNGWGDFGGHALVENRHGLLVDLRVSEAKGRSERQTAIEMLEQRQTRRALAVDSLRRPPRPTP